FEIPENKVFTDVAKGEVIERQKFMGKNFLITGATKKYKWKLTGKSEKILDYDCQKATYQVDSSQQYVAWFTPQIPVSAGPLGFSGLPGMILKLDRNNGEMTIEATKVDLRALEKNAIKKPKKGKQVTKAEFKKIREEKLTEMEAAFGGSGNRIYIRN
ncbi:MAG: GLPGLI family protein, partial [Bacteroidota bacterium]